MPAWTLLAVFVWWFTAVLNAYCPNRFKLNFSRVFLSPFSEVFLTQVNLESAGSAVFHSTSSHCLWDGGNHWDAPRMLNSRSPFLKKKVRRSKCDRELRLDSTIWLTHQTESCHRYVIKSKTAANAKFRIYVSKNQPRFILSRRVVQDKESLLAQTGESLQTGLVLGEHQKFKVRCQCVIPHLDRLSAASTAAWKPQSDKVTPQRQQPCRYKFGLMTPAGKKKTLEKNHPCLFLIGLRQVGQAWSLG